MTDTNVPKAGRGRGLLRDTQANADWPAEERGLIGRVGRVEIDWPKSLGYFGGIGLAVAFEPIEPPLALFIAAIPFIKLFKDPRRSLPIRFAADNP